MSNATAQENAELTTRTSDASCQNEATTPQGLIPLSILGELLSVDEYLHPRTTVFRSRGSLDWFIRRHKRQLAESAALYCITGRFLIHAKNFDKFVMAQGSKEWPAR